MLFPRPRLWTGQDLDGKTASVDVNRSLHAGGGVVYTPAVAAFCEFGPVELAGGDLRQPHWDHVNLDPNLFKIRLWFISFPD